jgi:hypothetical protein
MTDNALDIGILAELRDALVKKRAELLAVSTGTRPLPAAADVNSRQGDLADQATGNNEVHIQLKLKQTDAKICRPSKRRLSAWTRAPTASAGTAAIRSRRPGFRRFRGRACASAASRSRAHEN